MGTNTGNLLYTHGMYSALLSKDNDMDASYYSDLEMDAEEISEAYDYYVIPLADAFRTTFIGRIKQLTRLVKKIKIPCILTGVGLRGAYEPKIAGDSTLDAAVKQFVSALLDKSSIVGVRGQITADYLSRLGFVEGRDHMAIGCPSMYTWGRHLKVRDASVTEDAVISLNSSLKTHENINAFMKKTAAEFPNHYFIGQEKYDFLLTYLGEAFETDRTYPCNLADSLYAENRVRFFLNVRSWVDFLAQSSLCVGSKIHGVVAAILAGTPVVFFAKDARTRELAEYHNIPHLPSAQVDEDKNLMDMLACLDMHGIEKRQHENFDRFVTFLDRNGLPHIYRQDRNAMNTYMFDKMKGIVYPGAVIPINHCEKEEIIRRATHHAALLKSRIARQSGEIKDLRKKLKALQG